MSSTSTSRSYLLPQMQGCSSAPFSEVLDAIFGEESPYTESPCAPSELSLSLQVDIQYHLVHRGHIWDRDGQLLVICSACIPCRGFQRRCWWKHTCGCYCFSWFVPSCVSCLAKLSISIFAQILCPHLTNIYSLSCPFGGHPDSCLALWCVLRN